MFIKIYSKKAKSVLFRSQLLRMAVRYIKNKQVQPQEQKLDQYLQDTVNYGLIETSLRLLREIKFQAASSNELVITFVKRDYDKLATLITYGNGAFQGSSILVNAFKYAQGEL